MKTALMLLVDEDCTYVVAIWSSMKWPRNSLHWNPEIASLSQWLDIILAIFWHLLLWFLVSSDDEIDYSVKPEFYDPNIDDIDEKWAHKQRKGRSSDAILSCPACFTTLCLDCQRYDFPSLRMSVRVLNTLVRLVVFWLCISEA